MQKPLPLPLVRVVVPVYNGGIWLIDCLESIAAQTYPNFECILVNDGSTDNSGAVCDEFAHSHPQFRVVHQPNQGFSGSYNRGLDEAKGKYLVYCDQDDRLAPTTLTQATTTQSAHPGDFICWSWTSALKTFLSFPCSFSTSVYASHQLCQYYMEHQLDTYTWGKLFDVSLIRHFHLRYDSTYKTGSEDAQFMLDYWTCLFQHKPCAKIRSLEAPFTFYNEQNSNSFTNQGVKKKNYLARQQLFARLTLIPFRDIFHCPNEDMVSLAQLILASMGKGMVYAAELEEPLPADFWHSSELDAVLQVLKGSKCYEPLYKPFLSHNEARCLAVTQKREALVKRRVWLMQKIYWLKYYLSGGKNPNSLA